MKNYYKLLLAILMIFSISNVNAQDENSPWQFVFGANAVDFFPTGEGAPFSENLFDELFNVTDNFNFLPTLSTVSISRYLNNNVTIGLTGSFNQIDRLGTLQVPDEDLTYFAIDFHGKFDFSDIVKSRDIGLEPYGGLGLGLTFLDSINAGTDFIGTLTLNGIAGLTWWWASNFGINIESKYKLSIDQDRVPTHFQHSIGLAYKFGGKGNNDE